MKKSQVLKALPEIKATQKRLRDNERERDRLDKSISRDREIVEALDGVELFENVPVHVENLDSGEYEISSGYDENTRSAYVALMAGSGTEYRVTGYASPEASDGKTLGEGLTKSKALRAAKRFVAGTSAKPKTASDTPKAAKAKRTRKANA